MNVHDIEAIKHKKHEITINEKIEETLAPFDIPIVSTYFIPRGEKHHKNFILYEVYEKDIKYASNKICFIPYSGVIIINITKSELKNEAKIRRKFISLMDKNNFTVNAGRLNHFDRDVELYSFSYEFEYGYRLN